LRIAAAASIARRRCLSYPTVRLYQPIGTGSSLRQRARSLEALFDIGEGQRTGRHRIERPAPRGGVELAATTRSAEPLCSAASAPRPERSVAPTAEGWVRHLCRTRLCCDDLNRHCSSGAGMPGPMMSCHSSSLLPPSDFAFRAAKYARRSSRHSSRCSFPRPARLSTASWPPVAPTNHCQNSTASGDSFGGALLPGRRLSMCHS